MNDYSIMNLILQANWTVQLIMLILLIASIVSWTFIFKYIRMIKQTVNKDMWFNKRFWSEQDITKLYRDCQNLDHLGQLHIFMTGFKEFSILSKKTSKVKVIMNGVQRMMNIACVKEYERLKKQVAYLATLGSTAPYVGLLGTVIGVMNAFRSLSGMQQTTIDAVAPGIAEALVATAIGLIAAIPAVIAYNRFNHRIDKCLTGYEIFAEEFYAILYRRLYDEYQNA